MNDDDLWSCEIDYTGYRTSGEGVSSTKVDPVWLLPINAESRTGVNAKDVSED